MSWFNNFNKETIKYLESFTQSALLAHAVAEEDDPNNLHPRYSDIGLDLFLSDIVIPGTDLSSIERQLEEDQIIQEFNGARWEGVFSSKYFIEAARLLDIINDQDKADQITEQVLKRARRILDAPEDYAHLVPGVMLFLAKCDPDLLASLQENDGRMERLYNATKGHPGIDLWENVPNAKSLALLRLAFPDRFKIGDFDLSYVREEFTTLVTKRWSEREEVELADVAAMAVVSADRCTLSNGVYSFVHIPENESSSTLPDRPTI